MTSLHQERGPDRLTLTGARVVRMASRVNQERIGRASAIKPYLSLRKCIRERALIPAIQPSWNPRVTDQNERALGAGKTGDAMRSPVIHGGPPGTDRHPKP